MTVDKLFKAIQELHVMYCHQEPTPGRSQSKTHYKFKELTSFFSCVFFFSPFSIYTNKFLLSQKRRKTVMKTLLGLI